MNLNFIETSIKTVKEKIIANILGNSSLIDGYLADHICSSRHYSIESDNNAIGYFSIHKNNLITQFFLERQYSSISQEVFYRIKKMENVQFAFVPICDEFFLSHALDDFERIEKQAYFFNYGSKNRISIAGHFQCKPAQISDYDFIKENSEDFFNDGELQGFIKKGEVYIAYNGNDCVGFGTIIKSGLLPDVADIGMYTISRFRKQGNGKSTIQWLINQCLDNNLTVSAGCWYYNHNSKKTLEKAGMSCSTRLLKIKL